MPVRPMIKPTTRPARPSMIELHRLPAAVTALMSTHSIDKGGMIGTAVKPRDPAERTRADHGEGGLRGAGGGRVGGGPDRAGAGQGRGARQSQDIPQNFLENILTELRRGGLVRTRRGAEGGYQLARPAKQITVADGAPRGRGPARGGAGRPAPGPRLRRARRSTCPSCGSRCGRACAVCWRR